MIEGLKPYAEYQILKGWWLDRLPLNWSALSLRRCCRIFAGATPSRNEPQYWRNGTIPWLSSGDVNLRRIVAARQFITKAGFNNSSTKWIRPGSLVVALAGQGRTKGMVATVEFQVTCNQSLAAIEPHHGKWNYTYLAYFIESRYSHLRRLVGDDLRDGLNLQHIKAIQAPLPPPDEQAAIVRFLDHANRKIDGFIRAKRKLIGLLNEQKQAIIHRAVTRGLHPDVPLKPSGIPWLGDIPTHWEVRRLKSHLACNDGGVWGSTFDDEGTTVLRSTEQAMDGSWRIKSPAIIRLTTAQIGSALLLEGDIVVTKSSGSQNHIGKASLVTSEIASLKCCYSNFMQRLRTTAALSPNYLAMFLNSRTGRVHYQFTSTSTTGLGNLTRDTLANLPMPMPVRSEQEKILRFVDLELKPLNTAIARTEREIALMQEYRTRLTADLVTGKLDVREAALMLPDHVAEINADTEIEDPNGAELSEV